MNGNQHSNLFETLSQQNSQDDKKSIDNCRQFVVHVDVNQQNWSLLVESASSSTVQMESSTQKVIQDGNSHVTEDVKTHRRTSVENHKMCLSGMENTIEIKTDKRESKEFFENIRNILNNLPKKIQERVKQEVLDIVNQAQQEAEVGSDSDPEYESGAPGPSNKKKIRTEIEHEKCVTTCLRKDFKPSETQSTDNEFKRRERKEKRKERNREYQRAWRQRKNALKKKVSKEEKEEKTRKRHRVNQRAYYQRIKEREFRAQQEQDIIVKIATEDIRSAGPSEDNKVPRPVEISIIEKRAKSAEATRRWRETKKGVSESSEKQPKTAAQRMREYRKRKKCNSPREINSPKNEVEVEIKCESDHWNTSNTEEYMKLENDIYCKVEIDEEKVSLFQCALCSGTFSLPVDWVLHMQQYTTKDLIHLRKRNQSTSECKDEVATLLHCEICHQHFNNPDRWLQHVQESHRDTTDTIATIKTECLP